MNPNTVRSIIFIIFITLFPGTVYAQQQDKNYKVRDYTPEGFVRQPSFVEKGGQINRNEHALIFYIDGAFIPPALMVGYHYGLFYWWDIGLDVGGDYGMFQALLHTRMEMLKTRETEFFYWGQTLETGYKYVYVDISKNLYFDDKSWVTKIDNTFAFRFGAKRDKTLYLDTLFYIDTDLHRPRRQTDLYLAPLLAGYEMMIGNHFSFFVEGGALWSINGTQTDIGLLYKGDWFPVGKIGFAWRSGDRTAIYYAKETMDMVKKK